MSHKKTALLLLAFMLSGFSCSEDPLLKKLSSPGAGSGGDTEPAEPYDGPVDMATLDWATTDQQITSNCAGVDFLFSYSKSFDGDGEPVTGPEDAFYFGATGSLVSGADANQSLFYYISLDLEDATGGTDTIVDGNSNVDLPRSTNYHYAVVWTLDNASPTVHRYSGGSWSVFVSGGTFNKSGATLGGELPLDSIVHPETGIVAENGLAVTAYLYDTGTSSFQCGLTENSFYVADTVQLFDYLSLDFAFPAVPNDSSRISYGLGDYVHTLADNNELDFWPAEKLASSTSETDCIIHAAYDADWLYLGVSGDDIAGSEIWLNLHRGGISDTLADFTFGGTQWSASPELFRIFGLTDTGTPTVEYYETDGTDWTLSGDTVDFEVFTDTNFVKWKLNLNLIPNLSRFYILKTDSDEIVCAAGEDITLPKTELGITPQTQIDSNLVIPPGLQ